MSSAGCTFCRTLCAAMKCLSCRSLPSDMRLRHQSTLLQADRWPQGHASRHPLRLRGRRVMPPALRHHTHRVMQRARITCRRLPCRMTLLLFRHRWPPTLLLRRLPLLLARALRRRELTATLMKTSRLPLMQPRSGIVWAVLFGGMRGGDRGACVGSEDVQDGQAGLKHRLNDLAGREGVKTAALAR